MNTDLNSYLPVTDPYSLGESISSIPSSRIVDWVEVQLRTGTSVFMQQGQLSLNMMGVSSIQTEKVC